MIPRQLLSGHMIFDGSDINATVRHLCREIQNLRNEDSPRPLCVAPLFLNSPHGRLVSCHVMWADEDEGTGATWIDKVSNFAKVQKNGVRKTTHAGATEDFGQDFAPTDAHGSVDTISIRALTDEVVDVIARNVEITPAQFGTGLAIHVAPSPSENSLKESVFGAHEAHYMLEFLHTSTVKESVEESTGWAKNFLAEIQRTDQANILPSTYISLTPPGRNTLKQIYGSNYDFVMALKKKYDPENVFGLAVPFAYLK